MTNLFSIIFESIFGRRPRHRKGPLSSYEKWAYRNRLTKKMEKFMQNDMRSFRYLPKFSFIIPVYNTDERMLREALDSISAQLYGKWEACIVNDGSTRAHIHEMLQERAKADRRFRYKRLLRNAGVAGASNVALKMAKGDHIVFMDHDDTVEKDLLLQVAKYLQSHKDADIIYTDNDRIDLWGRPVTSHFKPDWSQELLYSYCYVSHASIFSRNIIERTGLHNQAFPGAQDHEYILRASERTDKIGHIPLALYHWRDTPGRLSNDAGGMEHGRRAVEESLKRRGIDWVGVGQPDFAREKVLSIFKLVPRGPFEEKVSIIISGCKDQRPIKGRVGSVIKGSAHKNLEVITVADGSLKRKNAAVKKASGEYIIFLDAGAKIVSKDWIEQLLVYCKMPAVGVVGGKLVSEDGSVGRFGIVKARRGGLTWAASSGVGARSRGYLTFAAVARNYSLVSSSCMMIKKRLFLEAGGFDPGMISPFYADADLCLKVLSKGSRVVSNPYAALALGREGLGKEGRDIISQIGKLRFAGRWKDHVDRYYNINQSPGGGSAFGEDTGKNNRMFQFDLRKNKVKVLSVSHSLEIGGAEHVKLAVDKHLSGNDFDVEVLSVENGPLRENYEKQKIKVSIDDFSRKGSLIKYIFFRNRIKEYIEKKGYDLVYANTLNSFWAVDAARLAGVPSVWNIHEGFDLAEYFDSLLKHRSVRRIAAGAFEKSNRNVFVGDSTAENSARRDKFGTIDVVSNGIDLRGVKRALKLNRGALKKELGIPEGKTIVSVIGTTAHRKRQLDFARAAVSILRKRDDVCFLIVGARRASYLNKIEEVVKGSKGIVIVEQTPDVLKYFRVSDILVSASQMESFSLTMLMAAYFSLPIITTPVFGLPEHLIDGWSGSFFPIGDVAKLEEEITKLLDDGKLRKELGGNAYLTVKDMYRESDMVKDYGDLFRTVALEDVN